MDDAKERTLWCGNLSDEVTEELLYELFLQAGPLEKVTIAKDKEGNKKSFSFITFKHDESVPYTIQLMTGIKLFGRILKLQTRTGASHGSIGTPTPPGGQIQNYNNSPMHNRGYSGNSSINMRGLVQGQQSFMGNPMQQQWAGQQQQGILGHGGQQQQGILGHGGHAQIMSRGRSTPDQRQSWFDQQQPGNPNFQMDQPLDPIQMELKRQRLLQQMGVATQMHQQFQEQQRQQHQQLQGGWHREQHHHHHHQHQHGARGSPQQPQWQSGNYRQNYM